MVKRGRPSPSWVPPPSRLFLHWPAGRAQSRWKTRPHPERPDCPGGVCEGREAPGGLDTRAPGVGGSWGVDPDQVPWRKEACAEPLLLPLVLEPQTRAPGRAAAGLPSGGGLCSPVSSTSEEEARQPRQRGVAGVLSLASSECLPPPWALLGGHCPSSEETEAQGEASCGHTGPSAPRPGLPTSMLCGPHTPAQRSSRWVWVGASPPQTSAPRSEALPSRTDTDQGPWSWAGRPPAPGTGRSHTTLQGAGRGRPDSRAVQEEESRASAPSRGRGALGVSRDPPAPAQHTPKLLPFRGSHGAIL
ncbi:unnamed protein product, partial [Rangifer tarandus platyrhynchus]|uniref:Uncharacterized protein n=1 Tax=Rangifer tarandus platyrhynchus TaxID=3082113 RepID=A0AC59ZVM1_RANTA